MCHCIKKITMDMDSCYALLTYSWASQIQYLWDSLWKGTQNGTISWFFPQTGLPVGFYLRKKETGHAGGRAVLCWARIWLCWARWWCLCVYLHVYLRCVSWSLSKAKPGIGECNVFLSNSVFERCDVKRTKWKQKERNGSSGNQHSLKRTA